MEWVLIIGVGWLALALVTAAFVGRAIRLADAKAAEARARRPAPEPPLVPEQRVAVGGSGPPPPVEGPPTAPMLILAPDFEPVAVRPGAGRGDALT